MRNKLKPILSILALAVFLFLAFASEFLDESTNTEVQADHCKPMPQISGKLTIHAQYLDEDGDPLNGLAGTFSINHQVIVDTVGCQYDNTHSFITFHLDAQGRIDFTTTNYIHDNEADLYRVEINIKGSPGEWEGFREIKVAPYGITSLTFFKKDPLAL